MNTKTIGFVGGGRITRIFLHAFEKNGYRFQKVWVFDTNKEAMAQLSQRFPSIICTEDLLEAAQAEVVFLAIHPPVMMDTLAKLNGNLRNDTLLVSLAPKITLEKINSALEGFANTARMNPSASTYANKGVNPVVFHGTVSTETKEHFLELMKPLGLTPLVDESKIEAYAVISAMGHTYFFFQLQKLKELAVEFGMEETEAKSVISDMLWGTTETLFKSGLSYQEAVDLVPVKPMSEVEEQIESYYEHFLRGIFNKIKP